MLALAVDPADSRVIYAGTLWDGVFKTINGGVAWSPASVGLPPAGPGRWVRQLIVEPASNLPPGPAVIEIVTDGGTTASAPDSFELLEEAAPIPTLTEWGIAFLLAALLSAGVLGLRRRTC